MKEERRDFDKEAGQWDRNAGRVKLANEVASAMIKAIGPTKDMDVLDFGCGTGLVTLRLQPYIRTITGVDSSSGMLDELKAKIEGQGLVNVYTQLVDFEKGERIGGVYDLIVSSMTAHHVPDTSALFRVWNELLKPGGRLCFADLDAEDGSFHSDTTGVFHLGFEREKLKDLLDESGFSEIRDVTAATITREGKEGSKKEFSVFLIEARKQ